MKAGMTEGLNLALTGLLLLTLCSLAAAEIRVVTTTADTGDGSLRQAMATAGADTIVFNIPDTDANYEPDPGIWRLVPESPLPQLLQDSTVIDGASQTDYAGNPNPYGPEIVVDGHLIEAEGLDLHGSHNRVHHITVQRFIYGLVVLRGDSNRVTGCFLGPDAVGRERLDISASGLEIRGGQYNIVGGRSETDRNVMSGNRNNGVFICNQSSHNHIIGNFIGVNASGTDTLGNSHGIRIASESHHNTIGPDNILSGNQGDAIVIQQDSDHNRILGNHIGTNPEGTESWGNLGNGIFLTGESSSNQIGGSTPEDRNLISGNGQVAIAIYSSGVDSNIVQGNYIGTDITGSVALPNRDNGITLRRGVKYNLIGGSAPGEGNLISGNERTGIFLFLDDNSHNRIEGNFIGTTADGDGALGNGICGIKIKHPATQNSIGPDNRIAFNGEQGIYIYSDAIQNTITENAIFMNGGPGIELATGGNTELDAPVLTQFSPLTGTAPANAVVEIFSGPDDEGKIYEATVTADATGHFSWEGTPTGERVTATATDAAGNTSEFSNTIMTGVDGDNPSGPGTFALYQNHPNPFNPETCIRYSLPRDTHVRLDIYNIQGQRIRCLVDTDQSAGEKSVIWDGLDARGRPAVSGLYTCRIETAHNTDTRKMLLLR